MDKSRKVIAVDIDDTISCGRFWECEPEPVYDMIEKINALYKQGHIIIYHTGRHGSYYTKTYAWLVKHGCFFHALRMDKLSADYYIDTNNRNIDEI